MNKLLIILGLVISGICLDAQNIYVLRVEGEVFADGELLKIKDKIAENSMIKFNGPDAMAYVVCPGKGYYILSGQNNKSAQKRTAKNEFLVSLKDAMIPPNQYYKTSTRTVGHQNFLMEDIYDLKAFFRNDLWAVDDLQVPLKPGTFFENDDDHFFLKVNNRQIILPSDEDLITLKRDLVDIVDDFNLYYHTAKGDKHIGEFRITFINGAELADELDLFKENSGLLSAEDYRFHALSYVQHVYGKTNPESLALVLKQQEKINN